MNQLDSGAVRIHRVDVGRIRKYGIPDEDDFPAVRRESRLAGDENRGICQTFQARAIDVRHPDVWNVLCVFMIVEH